MIETEFKTWWFVGLFLLFLKFPDMQIYKVEAVSISKYIE